MVNVCWNLCGLLDSHGVRSWCIGVLPCRNSDHRNLNYHVVSHEGTFFNLNLLECLLSEYHILLKD